MVRAKGCMRNGVDNAVGCGIDDGDGVGVAVGDVEAMALGIESKRGGMEADCDLGGDRAGGEVDAGDGAGGSHAARVDNDVIGAGFGAGGRGAVRGSWEAAAPVADPRGSVVQRR